MTILAKQITAEGIFLKQQFNNTIKEQVLTLDHIVDTQLRRCFNDEKLQALMTVSEIFDARKMIITGCGDSYAAAGVMQDVFTQYSDTFGCEAVTAIDYARFISAAEIGMGEPNSPVVLVVSAGGSTSRIIEILQKSAHTSASTILITNSLNTPAVDAADKVLFLDTPSFGKASPGLRTYFASLVGLAAVLCRIGYVRGTLSPTAPQQWPQAIGDYIHTVFREIDKIDSAMFILAQQWKDFKRFEFIGDARDLFSASFCADKIYECTGWPASYDDSENWCHINYFVKEPESVGTVFLADKNLPSFGRIQETIESARKIGRPVLVVTNAEKAQFNQGVAVCKLADTPEGFEWLFPYVNYIPGALLAGYHSAINSHKFFNSFDLLTGEKEQTPYFNKEYFTLSSSQIEVHTK